MRLYNKNGIFDLPDGFVMSLERTSPFFTEEGDASIPVTLPSTPHNLHLIDHIERIDAKSNDMAKADAWLTVGAVTVKGTLLIDTLSVNDGIDAVFAFRNGGLYADWSDKSLKEVFDGMVEHYNSAADACAHLEDIYLGKVEATDYTCFPVMGQKEESVSQGYCIINNVSGNTLVYQSRLCYEGGILLKVPTGYGCTPFIYLHRLITLLFERMGYTVTENEFEYVGTTRFVVLNNCIDATLAGDIRYADMVPDMTVSEFMYWLRDRFMAQAVVDSNTMTVKIVALTSILTTDVGNGTDMDITSLLISDIAMRYEQPSRVVITPSVTEGAEAAAASKKALKERYGWWVELTESQYWSIANDSSPAYYDCLVMRLSTGVFYELQRDVNTGKTVMVPIGTNYFTYDRENADNSEAYSPADVMPLMYCGGKNEVYPIIGDHIHNHSSYNGMKANGKQNLIIVREWVDEVTVENRHAAFKRCGTTQNFMPLIDQGVSGFSSMGGCSPDNLYNFWWSYYNNILLNGKKTATMRINYDTATFLSIDMAFMKTFKNQRLLPVKMSMDIGEKTTNGESEFLVTRQQYEVTDAYIPTGAVNRFRWVMDNSAVNTFKNQCLSTPKFYDQSWNEVSAGSERSYWKGSDILPASVEVLVGKDNSNIYLGPPSGAGITMQLAVTVTVKGNIVCVHIEDNWYGPTGQTTTHKFEYSQDILITFTSQAY